MRKNMKNRMMYLGVGAGVLLFLIYGLLPGSFLGGAVGLSIAGMILGFPVEPGIIARAVIVLSMVAGVMVSGIIFIITPSFIGWLIGRGIDALSGEKETLLTSESGNA